MTTREQGMRRTAAVTAGVAAAAILGSVAVAAGAYAQDQAAGTGAGTGTGNSSTPGSASYSYPSVNGGSGGVAADAHSGGS